MKGVHAVRNFWRTAPAEYKDYLFIYLWGAIWGALCLIQPRVLGLDEWSLISGRLWALVTLIGGITAVVGVLSHNNLLIERLGLALLMVGPAAYSITLFGELVFREFSANAQIDAGNEWRIMTVVVFALWPFLFLNKRRRQLRERVTLVSTIPLRGEGGEK